jgi:hypothetical protein
MTRYANDLELTDLARQITSQLAGLNDDLRDGYLDAAFLKASNLQVKLEKLQWRLNDIKYGRVA